jgi:hypothetical protein
MVWIGSYAWHRKGGGRTGWYERKEWDEKKRIVGVDGWRFGTEMRRWIVLRESCRGALEKKEDGIWQ